MTRQVLFRALLKAVGSALNSKIPQNTPNRDEIILQAAMSFVKQAEIDLKREAV
jgi:hypothetical protein